jgi:hypothetical protein
MIMPVDELTANGVRDRLRRANAALAVAARRPL